MPSRQLVIWLWASISGESCYPWLWSSCLPPAPPTLPPSAHPRLFRSFKLITLEPKQSFRRNLTAGPARHPPALGQAQYSQKLCVSGGRCPEPQGLGSQLKASEPETEIEESLFAEDSLQGLAALNLKLPLPSAPDGSWLLCIYAGCWLLCI